MQEATPPPHLSAPFETSSQVEGCDPQPSEAEQLTSKPIHLTKHEKYDLYLWQRSLDIAQGRERSPIRSIRNVLNLKVNYKQRRINKKLKKLKMMNN